MGILSRVGVRGVVVLAVAVADAGKTTRVRTRREMAKSSCRTVLDLYLWHFFVRARILAR